MTKKNKVELKCFTPVVDCTPSDFIFYTEEAAFEEAKKMFKSAECRYLRKLAEYKTFGLAVESGLIYLVTYTVKG